MARKNKEELYQLRPLQREAVQKLFMFINIEQTRAVYNASDMGTGKSGVTLKLIEKIQFSLTGSLVGTVPILRSLIICPKVVKLNWRDEIYKWLGANRSTWIIDSEKQFLEDIDGIPSGEMLPEFAIVSYNLVMNPVIHRWLKKQKFDVLVLDEVHKVKGTASKTKKLKQPTMKAAVLEEIWPTCRYKICMSGTPFTRAVLDCFTIFSRILPSKFKDYYSFAKTYCYEESTPYGVNYYGIRNHKKLRKIIRDHFFIRYTKEQMAPELPEKIWTKIPLGEEYRVELTEEEKKLQEVYLKSIEHYMLTGDGELPKPPKHIATQKKEIGLKKVEPISEFVKNLVDNDIPVLLYCIHIDVLKQYVEIFKAHKPAIIYGATSDKDRYEAIRLFQEEETNLFIGQIHAAGIGTNLTRAECVILAENDYSPATIAQGVDRAHRIGQKNSVNVYYFVVEETLDERITKSVIAKAKTFAKVLTDE